VVAMAAHTDSAMGAGDHPALALSRVASPELLRAALEVGGLEAGGLEAGGLEAGGSASQRPWLHVGSVFTTDHFYRERIELLRALAARSCLAVEMETAALYEVAAVEGCSALAVLTISDHVFSHASLTALERETHFSASLAVALAALGHLPPESVPTDIGRDAPGLIQEKEVTS